MKKKKEKKKRKETHPIPPIIITIENPKKKIKREKENKKDQVKEKKRKEENHPFCVMRACDTDCEAVSNRSEAWYCVARMAVEVSLPRRLDYDASENDVK